MADEQHPAGAEPEEGAPPPRSDPPAADNAPAEGTDADAAAPLNLPAATEPTGSELPASEQVPASGRAAERPQARRRERGDGGGSQQDVVPGAHLEPDLVLEGSRPDAGEADPYASYADAGDEPVADVAPAEREGAASAVNRAAHAGPLRLAADARYRATGKRKTAVARVTLKPGNGTYTVNGRPLGEFFPRHALEQRARRPLEVTGNGERMDVVARIHGGGVSSQAGALRHGIARALVEADPNLRGELKRGGFLTRDARVKERKKAGLKKARKRPQFSKR